MTEIPARRRSSRSAADALCVADPLHVDIDDQRLDGLLIIERDGGLQAWSIDWNTKGEVQTICAVRNPDKSAHLRTAIADLA